MVVCFHLTCVFLVQCACSKVKFELFLLVQFLFFCSLNNSDTHTLLFFFCLFVIYKYLVSVLYVAHCAYYCCCSLVSLFLSLIFMLLFVVIVIDYCVLIIKIFFSLRIVFNSWNDNNIHWVVSIMQ